MVQGYPKKDNTCPSLGYSSHGGDSVETSASVLNQNPTVASPVLPHTELCKLVNIRMSNGVHIS